MYRFLDRPVASLVPGSRLLLWAARGWAQARVNGTCPPGAVAPVLLHCGAGSALPHFHRLMLALEGEDGVALAMPALDDPRVDDVEAVLLQLWSDALACPLRARRTLSLMLAGDAEDGGDEQVTEAFAAVAAIAARLASRGLAPVGLALAGDATA